MVDLILEPFRQPFMRAGLVAALFIGLACGSLGVYVVLRRMAFIGDALAHTALPGLVIAYLMHGNLSLGALAAGLLTALGISSLTRREVLREDTAIGVLFTGMLALGVVLISTAKSYRDLTHMLFGNLLGVSRADLLLIAGVAILVIGTLALLHKELELTSVDAQYGEVIGLSPDRVRTALLVLLALTVVAGIQAVGVVLTSALLVTPAATASLFTRRLGPMMGWSVAVSLFAAVVGLYASYYGGVAPGATIVLVCTILFMAVWAARELRHRHARRPRSKEANFA